jgi:AraC-like DNA-binding protein
LDFPNIPHFAAAFRIMETALIFLAGSYAPRNCSYLDKHLEGYATIQFSRGGGVEVGYDERFFTLTGGDWFWPAHPGPRIRFRPAPGHAYWSHRHIGFQGPLVGRWMAAGLWLAEPQLAPPGRDWSEFFAEMVDHSRRGDHWGRLRAINMLEHLLLELAEARVAAPAREPWLERVLEQLAVNVEAAESSATSTSALNYAALAREAGCSLTVLRRRFKAATGATMHSYVVQSRIAAARALLAETDLPIKAIADRLGYNNVYFFSRQFRAQAGVAPGQFRKSRQ